MSKLWKRFNLNLPMGMYTRIKASARYEEMTITSLIRYFIRKGLKDVETKQREELFAQYEQK